jgi:hypothetical protein
MPIIVLLSGHPLGFVRRVEVFFGRRPGRDQAKKCNLGEIFTVDTQMRESGQEPPKSAQICHSALLRDCNNGSNRRWFDDSGRPGRGQQKGPPE